MSSRERESDYRLTPTLFCRVMRRRDAFRRLGRMLAGQL